MNEFETISDFMHKLDYEELTFLWLSMCSNTRDNVPDADRDFYWDTYVKLIIAARKFTIDPSDCNRMELRGCDIALRPIRDNRNE